MSYIMTALEALGKRKLIKKREIAGYFKFQVDVFFRSGVVSKLNYIKFRTLRVNPKVDINTRLSRDSKETSTSRFTLRGRNVLLLRQPRGGVC